MRRIISPPPAPSQEGVFCLDGVCDCVACLFDPGSPQKNSFPLRGGGRGWATVFLSAMAMLVLSTSIAANAGAAFENGLGARAYGLGQAMSAAANDATAVYWNPAGLSAVTGVDFGMLKYDAYETNYLAGQAAFRFGDMGVGMGYVGAGVSDIVRTTRQTGRAVATGETSNYGAHGFFVGVGMPVLDDLRAGLTAKYLTESLVGYSATGFGVDVGVQYTVNHWIEAGLVIQNLVAPQMAWDTPSGTKEPVKMAVRPGVSVHLSREVQAMAQVDWRENRGTQLLWGAEYWPMEMLAIRGGYNAREFSLGTGVRLGGLSIDVTWSTAWTEGVADTYRVGVGYGW